MQGQIVGGDILSPQKGVVPCQKARDRINAAIIALSFKARVQALIGLRQIIKMLK